MLSSLLWLIGIILVVLVIAPLSLFILVRRFHFVLNLYLFGFVPFFGLILDGYAYLFNEVPPLWVSGLKDVVWLMVFLIFCLRLIISGARIPKNVLPVLLGILAMIGYSLLVTILNSPNASYLSILLGFRNDFSYVGLILLTLASINSRPRIESFLRWLAVTMVITGIIAAIQAVFSIPSRYQALIGRFDLAQELNVRSGFISYIELSYFSSVVLVVLIMTWRYIPKPVVLLAVASACFSIIASNSRMGLMAMAVLSIFLALRRPFNVRPALLLMTLVLCSLILLPNHRFRRELFQSPRWLEWEKLVPTWLERPAFGYGLGTFGPAMYKASQINSPLQTEVGYVDSFVLNLLLTRGLVGLIIFVAVVGSAAWLIRQAIVASADPFYRSFLSGVMGALLVAVSFSIPFNLIDGFPGGVFFWALLGVGLSAQFRSVRRLT